jgi:hypothetical protein
VLLAAYLAWGDRLVWDPSSGQVDGYKVHWGTSSGYYPNSMDVGNVLEIELTKANFPNMQRTGTYYFVVTAYNEAGESDYSNMAGPWSPSDMAPPPLPAKPLPELKKPEPLIVP